MDTVSRKEQLANRINAFSSLYGHDIDKVEANEGQLDVSFMNGAHLIIALADHCEGKRSVTMDPIDQLDTVHDISILSFLSQMMSHEKRDLIRLRFLTSTGSKVVEFHNVHPLTCKRFCLRYKVSLSGLIGERGIF